jgi:tetratricopeptide (TPR) repeat protein
LVQAGVMREEDIGHQVAMQVNGIVVSLFEVEQGIYSFDERACSIPIDLMVSLSIHRILLDGIRTMPNPDGILECLPPLDTSVRVAERPPFTCYVDQLTPIERDVLRSVGEGAVFEEIVRKFPEDRGPVLLACYGLYTSGILKSGDGEATECQLKVQEETKTFRLSELERCLGKTQATSIQQEIRVMHESLDQTPDDQLLQIDSRSTDEEIEGAYRERCSEWSWVRSLVQNEPSLAGKINEIEARLETAYQRVLAQRKPPAVENQPQSQPGDDANSKVRTDTLSGPGGSTVPREAAAARPSRAEREGPTVISHRVLADAIKGEIRTRVGQILGDVERHSKAQDWEGAIALLFELVELVPQNASYRAMLARTLSKYPLQRRRAERHFIEALRLAPQDAEVHVSLGLYYKSFGLGTRAETEFRTALRIDPGHAEARRQLTGERNSKASWGELFNRMLSSAAG